MVCRIFWGKLRLGKWAEYERYYNEVVVPGTAKMHGFRGRQLLRSSENPDEGISLTFWETKQDMEKLALQLENDPMQLNSFELVLTNSEKHIRNMDPELGDLLQKAMTMML